MMYPYRCTHCVSLYTGPGVSMSASSSSFPIDLKNGFLVNFLRFPLVCGHDWICENMDFVTAEDFSD
jgi:hypothetical protein